MKWVMGIFLASVVATVGLSFGIGRRHGGTTVNVVGSTSIQPFAEMLAQEFNRANPGINVEVQGGGSMAGLQGAEKGYANIGMCSRDLESGEDFNKTIIAYDGIAVVVHNGNPVKSLTIAQVRDIFAGKIKNWNQVGGRDLAITIITREEGSGTREAFTNLVMEAETGARMSRLKAPYKDPATMPAEVKERLEALHRDRPRITMYSITEPSNGSVKALVSGDPAAIGHMSLGQVNEELKGVAVDGVEPTRDNVLNKSYRLVRPFLFVAKGEPDAPSQKFIDYVLSDEGQRILEREGLVRVSVRK